MVLQRKLRPSTARVNIQLARGMQLANTPPLQSTTPGLHPVSFHQMAPPVRGNTHLATAYYSVYRPRQDERLSRPGWLVTYRNKVPSPGVEPGHVTHPSTNRARRRVTSLARPSQSTRAVSPPVKAAAVYIHRRHLLLLLSLFRWQFGGVVTHWSRSTR